MSTDPRRGSAKEAARPLSLSDVLAAFDLTAPPTEAAKGFLELVTPRAEAVLQVASVLEHHAEALREIAKTLR